MRRSFVEHVGRLRKRSAWSLFLLIPQIASTAFAAAGASDSGDVFFDWVDSEYRAKQLVVSATKTEQTYEQAQAAITVITRDDIVRLNVRSIAEALQRAPGAYINFDYVNYDVGIRGISGEMR